MRARTEEMMATDSGERWGVWITQDKPRSGGLPQSYWWQGPDYYGDCLLTTRAQAEAEAAAKRTQCPKWMYEARLYTRTAQ
jgi:hypothetical protein